MSQLSVDAAFAAYERVRHRLPPAMPDRPAPRRISDLSEIEDDFDTFLLDAFGVLNIGDSPIETTPARVCDLQNAGKRVLVVSNAASVPRTALVEKYRRLGYAFAPEDIITSRLTAISAMSDEPNLLWGVMGLSDEQMSDFCPIRWRLLGDDPESYDAVEAFVLVGSGDWSEQRQAMLETSLSRHPRPLHVANPDIVAPREDGFSAEPGHFAHRLAETSDVAPVFHGKPFGNIYRQAAARLGSFDASRTVMVGDSLHTDILGAQTAGIASVLIAGYGFFAGQDVDAAIATSGIVPDFIADRP